MCVLFWSCAFNVHSKCFGSSSFASWPVWLGIWHVCVGGPNFSFHSAFWGCVRTGYPAGIISGWVAMLGTFCNLSSLESLCRSDVSLWSEKSFFGSCFKILDAPSSETFFDHVPSKCPCLTSLGAGLAWGFADACVVIFFVSGRGQWVLGHLFWFQYGDPFFDFFGVFLFLVALVAFVAFLAFLAFLALVALGAFVASVALVAFVAVVAFVAFGFCGFGCGFWLLLLSIYRSIFLSF